MSEINLVIPNWIFYVITIYALTKSALHLCEAYYSRKQAKLIVQKIIKEQGE